MEYSLLRKRTLDDFDVFVALDQFLRLFWNTGNAVDVQSAESDAAESAADVIKRLLGAV